MAEPMPILLIPGLLKSPRFYAAQLAPLWRRGLVAIANHTQDNSIAAIAKRILADAPRQFALAGHSMGGYIAFEIMRQAPERVARLALIDTSARPDMPEQTERRQLGMAMAREGRFGKITEMLFPMLVHPNHRMDAALLELVQAMADDCGADAYIRQQTAIIGRANSRTTLAAIRCPTLVLVGDKDQLTPPTLAEEIAAGIPGARLVTIVGAGHLPALEQPDATNRALMEWLKA